MIDLQGATDLSKRYALLGKESRHPWWQRTQDLARSYRAFITGEDLEYKLVKFDRRESKEDFEQANRIAKQITPAITAALMGPARKVAGIRPSVDRVDYGKENDPNADALKEAISKFYGGESVDSYLATLIDQSYIDPNAFQLLTFDPFDPRFEKPSVYPVHIPSANVWDFRYLNGELEWLWMGFDIKYITEAEKENGDGTTTPAKTADGLRMVFYNHENHIVYEQIDHATTSGKKGQITDADGNTVTSYKFSDGNSVTDYFLRTTDDRLFRVRFYEQKSGRVPAFRLGCKVDPLTGSTCVNGFHDGIPYLEKNLKHVRELDLSVALHTFPQKIQYVSKCLSKGCQGGMLATGEVCGGCKGSGFTTIGTAQDHITLPMPRDAKEMLDLSQIVHYVPAPIDIVTQLMEIVKEDRSDAFRAVYGSDLYGQGNVGKTYEEVIAQNQAMYDALQGFAKWWSAVRTITVVVFAAYNDKAANLNVVHKMPRSFGFENSATIFGMMKGGREAGASKTLLANLNATALNIAFRDDAIALNKALTQARFDPFPGMTEDTITSLISGGKATEKSAMLWTESATVFALAEAKYTGSITFYELAESKQREVIDEIVAQLIEDNKPEPIDVGPMLGIDPLEDPNADPNADPSIDPTSDPQKPPVDPAKPVNE